MANLKHEMQQGVPCEQLVSPSPNEGEIIRRRRNKLLAGSIWRSSARLGRFYKVQLECLTHYYQVAFTKNTFTAIFICVTA